MEDKVMLGKLKSMFKRKPKPDTWRYLSKDDRDELIQELLFRLKDIEEDNQLLIKELGEMSSYCDKCDGGKNNYCLKCKGSGIVKKSRLIDWPWK